MDRNDLRARLEAATISWRHGAMLPTKSSAKESHTQLLSSLDTYGRRKSEYQIGPGDIRQLITELRTISFTHVNGASEALRELVEAGCRFEYEQENMGDERHWVSLRIDEIPYLDSTRTALPLIRSFWGLPQAQQPNLVRLLEEEKAVRHLEVRLQLEQEDGTRAAQVRRALTLASAQASLNRTLASILPSGRDWLATHRDTINLLGWSNLTLPILGTVRFIPEQLHQASESIGLISDCLVMPFPLDPGADPRTRERWLALWQICEEAAENLSMVSAWLRCLGSTGEYKRCRVCFRHVGEGMKKNCWLHHRTAKVRIPSRELHVSELYRAAWKQTAEHHPEIRALLNNVSPTEETEALMLQAAERERLAPEVTIAAATLATLLRSLLPLMEQRLQARVKRQFDASVAEANQRLMARRGINRDMSLTPPGQALKGLRWERFFGNLFASAMSSDEATGFAAGKLFDIDHPLASTNEAITVQKLALDLLHLDIWIAVDMAFDAYSYLDADAVRQGILTATEEKGSRPTYRELASRHRTTPQTVQQALSRKLPARRRYRVLEQGRKELKRLLLKRLAD